MTVDQWFALFPSWGERPPDALEKVRAALGAGHLDAQDEWGMSALMLAASQGWEEAVNLLLAAGASTRHRYFLTGETALHLAVQEKRLPVLEALLKAGANPDAGNYYGVTPRELARTMGKAFAPALAAVPERPVEWPAPRIQNAEHLADHYYPRFKIPSRKERETLAVGQAVDLRVCGPKKPEAVKVRIRERSGSGAATRYRGAVETPVAESNLAPGTTELEFGPEHVATVWLQQPA